MLGVRSAQPIAASGHPTLRESALPRKRPSATPMQQVVMGQKRKSAYLQGCLFQSFTDGQMSRLTPWTGSSIRHVSAVAVGALEAHKGTRYAVTAFAYQPSYAANVRRSAPTSTRLRGFGDGGTTNFAQPISLQAATPMSPLEQAPSQTERGKH